MNGFQYQLVGTKHATMLAVSIYTLRKHNYEPIQILCGDSDALNVARLICQDSKLKEVGYHFWKAPKTGGKGQQHANKSIGVGFSPFNKTIFLDADTTVEASLNELWPKYNEVHLTRFADWVTTGNMMGNRLDAWTAVAPEKVDRMKSKPYPALNTGVFSFTRESAGYLSAWRELTLSNPIFMSDELAAQLIFIDHPHIVHSDRWNFSPKFSIKDSRQIRVIHYHGMQHARPDKSEGWRTWMIHYQDCLDENRCSIRDLPKDKHLSRFLKDNPKFPYI